MGRKVFEDEQTSIQGSSHVRLSKRLFLIVKRCSKLEWPVLHGSNIAAWRSNQSDGRCLINLETTHMTRDTLAPAYGVGSTAEAPDDAMATRAVTAATIGTALEWFDFTLYGTVAATILPRLFFPAMDPTSALLASLATFGVGLAARPLGAIICGYLGDKLGRRNLMLGTVSVMGLASVLMGDSALIINPAGFSFGSIPVLDAVKLIRKPVVEVHITNIHQRSEQYQKSLISLAATGVICGLGPGGYLLAMRAVAEVLAAAPR